MPIAYVVPVRDLSVDEKDEIVENVVNNMVESEDTNNRDIPRKICFLEEMPTNAMSKNDFRKLQNRKLDGSEYTIDIKETNLSSSNVQIIKPCNQNVKVLKIK